MRIRRPRPRATAREVIKRVGRMRGGGGGAGGDDNEDNDDAGLLPALADVGISFRVSQYRADGWVRGNK